MKSIALALAFSLGSFAHGEPFVSVCQRQTAIRHALVTETRLPCEKITAIDLTYILNLRLSSRGIKKISATDFQGLSNLETLLLNNNEIEEIEIGTFRPLIELTILSLVGNRILELSAGAFDGLANLKVLILSDNKLVHIEPMVFRGLNQVFNLFLSGNPLSEFDLHTFQEMPLLQNIEYAETQVRRIPRGICSLNSKISLINLSANTKLTEIPDFAFSGCSPILNVIVRGSPLTNTNKAAFQGVSEVTGLPANFDQDGEGWEQP